MLTYWSDGLFCSAEKLGEVDYTVDLLVKFIESQSSGTMLRGPHLARLELMRLLRQRADSSWHTLFGIFNFVINV